MHNYPIILPPQQFEVLQEFTFYSHWVPIGRYADNINDKNFARKLNRVRGRLWLNNINYFESPSSSVVKQVRRMNDIERYNAKMSKVFAEFWRQLDKCTGLFIESDRQTVCIKYKATVAALRKLYMVS
jgi:hypothetical protein